MGTLFLITLLLACGPHGAADPTPTPADTPTSRVSDPTDDLLALLNRDLPGVEVTPGETLPLDASVCDEVTCPGGVNLSSPYGMWTMPGDLPPTDGAPTFQLDHDEVLVYVGPTPPEARYFSFTLYLYERTVAGDSHAGRGSIAGSLNHRVIGLAGPPESPFSRPIVGVVATNQGTASRAAELLTPVLASHGSTDALNVLAVPWRPADESRDLREDPSRDPTTIVDFQPGHGPLSDRYMVAWRAADPVDPDHPFFDATADPAHRGHLFRLRFDDPGSPVPFGYPRLPPDDASPHTEGDALREARDVVVDAVQSGMEASGLESIVIPSVNGPRKNGFRCVNGLEPCFLNSDDARYIRESDKVRMLGDSAALFFVGVLHDDVQDRVEGAADVAYSNISVVDRDDRARTLGSWMDRELRGSARAWFPDGVPGVSDAELDALFVLKVGRTCDVEDPVCGAVPEDLEPLARIGWTERVYLNEGTLTAPAPSAVWPVVGIGVAPEVRADGSDISLY